MPRPAHTTHRDTSSSFSALATRSTHVDVDTQRECAGEIDGRSTGIPMNLENNLDPSILDSVVVRAIFLISYDVYKRH